MNTQSGVNHTTVNPNSDIVIFTFFPSRTSGDEVVRKFKAALHYDHAVRFMPTLAQMSGGCPAGYGSDGSLSARIIHIFK